MCSLMVVGRGCRVDLVFHSPVVQPSIEHCGCFYSSCVCECVLWLCEIVFPMTDREMLTLTSQPIPIKTHRLWLMALLVCGFAQMGLHLSQDPCCLHSDPQRMVIQQLSFVNVIFFSLFFFLCFIASDSQLLFFWNSTSVFMSWCDVAKVIGIHSFTLYFFSHLH